MATWVSKKEAGWRAKVSDKTIQRWQSDNPDGFKKEHGKVFIDLDMLSKSFPVSLDPCDETKGSESRSELSDQRELMQIQFNQATLQVHKREMDLLRADLQIRDETIKDLKDDIRIRQEGFNEQMAFRSKEYADLREKSDMKDKRDFKTKLYMMVAFLLIVGGLSGAWYLQELTYKMEAHSSNVSHEMAMTKKASEYKKHLQTYADQVNWMKSQVTKTDQDLTNVRRDLDAEKQRVASYENELDLLKQKTNDQALELQRLKLESDMGLTQVDNHLPVHKNLGKVAH